MAKSSNKVKKKNQCDEKKNVQTEFSTNPSESKKYKENV